ncbi:MAG: Mpo1-like protein [Dongiaceae bacterium]
MGPARRFDDYRQFWAFYVAEHRKPATRRLHFVGTTLLLLCLALAWILGAPWLLLAGPVVAYGPAWIGHYFIEGNRPATFAYPVRGLVADFHMYGLMWLGRMDSEINRVDATDGEIGPG